MVLNFKDFVTVAQLATMCKTTRRTIYRKIEDGLAPRHERMADDRYYFYPDEAKSFADEWIRTHKKTRKGLTAGKAPANN